MTKLTAKEAARELGVSVPTLYAYVSRGLIRSEALEGKKRDRQYSSEDVQRLKDRKEQRRNPGKALEEALYWGAPILDSGLTKIEDGHLYYRGQDAAELAQTCSLEEVAALLWTGRRDNAAALLATPLGELSPAVRAIAQTTDDGQATSLPRLQAILSLVAQESPTAYDLRPAALARTGAQILKVMTMAFTGREDRDARLTQVLQRAWVPKDESAAGLLDTLLILCADHELSMPSFVARCIASGRSTLYAAVVGGLSGLQGMMHGIVAEDVAAMLDEVQRPQLASGYVEKRLRQGDTVPGFGHPLYPEGDPRGALLVKLVEETHPDSPWVVTARALIEATAETRGDRPTVSFGLSILTRALELPPGSALRLLTLGRSVGWIGHAIEEYGNSRLIRPRARYVASTVSIELESAL